MGKDTLPKNWPAGISYLLQPSYAPHVTKPQFQATKSRPPDLATEIPREFPRGPSSLVRIALIHNPSHPANGQAGLFATKCLPPGALVLPYYGQVHHSSNVAHEQSDYDLWLDRDVDLAVDAEKAGNEARFVNDFRGVSTRPNCEFRECWDLRRGERSIAVFVLPAGKNTNKKLVAGVRKGEELLVSYGKGFWGKRRHEIEGEGTS
ncbi:hypothetical protein F4821DRAFT_226154 [Hypoxylon rubiginosum]|uniref:Uncharacterized protein n=1 Tax=Hypoxylon rubiginosum TaxID=110542 RepID=A0ACC0DGI9_9PEZI|nr:hypothetical protein F4821DRAFT_226154 [Hypoxylon rubiginosum]